MGRMVLQSARQRRGVSSPLTPTNMDTTGDSHPPHQLLKLQINKQTPTRRPRPDTHLGNLQLAQLPHQLVHGSVYRTSSRITQEE